MKITFELNATEALEATENGTLKAFLSNCSKDETALRKAKETKEKTQQVEAPPVEAPPVETPTVTAPPQQFSPTIVAPPTTTAPITGTSQPTIDEVRAAIAPIIKAGKTAQMQALFKEFGAQKLTDIDSSNYAALMTKAAAL
jgi:cell division septation protein DedD